MIPELPSHGEPAPEKAMLARLIQRARIMNRVHDALQSTLDEAELPGALAATLVSRTGMGYSRAIIFRLDAKDAKFRVAVAYGAVDRETHLRLNLELEEEEAFDRAIEEPDSLELDWVNFEELIAEAAEERHDEDFLARIARKFGEGGALLQRLGGSTIESFPALAATDGLLGRLRRGKGCVLLSARDVRNAELPAALRETLTGESLWAMIRGRNGPRLILVVDKAFESQPIDEIDQIHMDWFCGQAAMALEKVELIGNLRRTNEALKSLDMLKSNFLSTVSHELRSPLTAITGFVRLLHNGQAGEVAPRQRELLARILSHGEKLTNIINDLIEIAEIDSGIAVNLNLGSVDPLNVFMETLPKLEPRRASRQAEIEPVFETGVPAIMADHKRLARILYHLIDNAVKFGGEKAKVRVEFVPRGEELAIRVVDQGIGIAPEKLTRIFDSFFQVDSQLARGYEGMGIGLTLIQKLVAGTGGRVEVESQLGKGSTFTVIYPIIQE